MPLGTPLHARTSVLNHSFGWREWSGYAAALSYETTHEREYNAVRNAAALFDVSPLFKYRLSGRQAGRLIDRLITRDATRIEVGQVIYTPWCDGRGKVLDDGTVVRLAEDVYRWTSADPNLRWIHLNAEGLEVQVQDVSEATAALALQGPTSRAVLGACAEGFEVDRLKYFRLAAGRIGGVPVEVSRTGYTGDLGFEVWMPAERSLEVWDALLAAGAPFEITPAGLHALDVARIEAGLILLGVEYVSARKAAVPLQTYTPWEIGLGRLVQLDKAPFVGQSALRRHAKDDGGRRLVGLAVDWPDVERIHERAGLTPALPATASRLSTPVYDDGLQVGHASSTTWSPTLKKLIALASVSAEASTPGTRLALEMAVEHRREQVGAVVAALPFFDPPRKRGGPTSP